MSEGGVGIAASLALQRAKRYHVLSTKDEQRKRWRAWLAKTAECGCPYVGLQESLPLGFVFLDHAVPDGDDTVRVLGDVVFMRHQYDRIAFRVQAIEQRHDLVAGL
jgi:hypothetical protein